MAAIEDILRDLDKYVQSGRRNWDESTKKRTLDVLRKLQHDLESPQDTMQRLIYHPLTLASITVSYDLGVFKLLSNSAVPLRTEDLAKEVNADSKLLRRILRHQASLDIITEVNQDTFAASNMTHNLAIPDIEAGIRINIESLGPCYQAIPSYLAKRQYRNPDNLHDTCFNQAWKTDEPLWIWINQDSQRAKLFYQFMRAQRSGTLNCFSLLDLDNRVGSAGQALFVDVGGATGQQCIEFVQTFPGLTGRVILQDLPAVVEAAVLPENLTIEKMEYDFFTKQPIKSAKYYYLRAILHDHTDNECLEILKNLVEAMSQSSTLLIDEIVMPNQQVDWYITQTDLAMMAQFSSMERTEDEWGSLLSKAGLVVQNITLYTHSFRLGIIICTKES